MTSLPARLLGLASGARAAAGRAANETTIRLAVTGLSRAGKTVFLTSMIANLLALGRGRDTLPAVQKRLEAGGESRLRAVRIAPAGAATVPLFDYAGRFAALAADPPTWPEPTEGLARLAIDIEIDRAGVLARLGPRRLRIEALDYPGEWLLDLPLLAPEFSGLVAGDAGAAAHPAAGRGLCRFPGVPVGLRRPGRRLRPDAAHRPCALSRGAARLPRAARPAASATRPVPRPRVGRRGAVPVVLPCPRRAGAGYGALALLAERFEAYKQDMRTPVLRYAFFRLRPPDRAGRCARRAARRPGGVRGHRARDRRHRRRAELRPQPAGHPAPVAGGDPAWRPAARPRRPATRPAAGGGSSVWPSSPPRPTTCRRPPANTCAGCCVRWSRARPRARCWASSGSATMRAPPWFRRATARRPSKGGRWRS